jgi:aminocarboxymuconate-semialdehyde decarboxylase
MSQFKINGHGHILPEPHEIPNFMKKKKLFWIDEDRKFMRQGNWSRPITDPSFFLKEKLEWMDKNQIDHGVMLNLSQLYCNGYSEQDALDCLHFQNDFNAKVQYEYSSKFTTGFVVQPLHIDQALNEIDRCVNTLGLKLLCLPTHFLNKDEEWTSVADEDCFPIWELANEHGLALEIHPYDGPKMIKLKDQNWRFHLVWMMAQTADTLHFFTLNNLANKYPKVRTAFAHGCMLGQANFGRRVQGFKGRPDLFKGKQDPRESLGAKNLFFDTLVHDPYTLQLLKHRVGSSQIISGLDDPYPLGEMESVEDCYPGQVTDEAFNLGIITEKEKQAIWSNNVENWLGFKVS